MNITVEQIKSVHAAANMMKSLNEHTDAKNLMELWETLKEYHKSSTLKIDPPSFEESQGERHPFQDIALNG